MKNSPGKGKPTQEMVRIAEIRDGIAILHDGTMRATLMASSVNFALKSEEEQTAIIFAYQDFFNSLDFEVQISVLSRRVMISPYLEQIKALREKQPNELLRLQMDEYVNFIETLVKDSNIMSKSFYLTVPFSVQQNRSEGFFSKMKKGVSGAARGRTLSDAEFERSREQLMQRVNQIAVGLNGLGLRLAYLQSKELLELYYTMYNPTTSHNQRLRDPNLLRVVETNEQP